MRLPLLVLTFLLTAGVICCPGALAPRQQSGSRVSSGEITDIADFRETRLRLPEKSEASFPVTPGELPVWESQKEVFVAGEQYASRTSELLQEYRLLLNREADLNGDGRPEEYTLRDGKITVCADSCIIWQSPDDWWVDYFFLGDANNDGNPELNLLVWKEGSFGTRKPFWVEEDDPAVKNHLFIFKLKGDTFKPVWQSSNLDRPNYRAGLIDLDGDGENELVVVEGSYSDPAEAIVTLWKWSGWGFSRLDMMTTILR